eukprot:SAG11_NODE_319_length_10822_cov_12.319500_2_plen_82_part_00
MFICMCARVRARVEDSCCVRVRARAITHCVPVRAVASAVATRNGGPGGGGGEQGVSQSARHDFAFQAKEDAWAPPLAHQRS